MTYATCLDCGSVGRHHYAHCPNSGQPRLEDATRFDGSVQWVDPKPADPVNHPPHYTQGKFPVECIDIVEHLNFCRGNAVKYIWRAGDKGNEIEDLKKARWYLDREIERLEKSA